MSYRQPFVVDEWFHCYNRGVDKRRIFQTNAEYERFLLLLYIGNGGREIHIANLKDDRLQAVLTNTDVQREAPLVEIGAYVLMPNHFHLVLKEKREGGISAFMQKVCTGYTMYFNKKNERTGTLFAGPFRSKHVPDDEYFKHLVSYVHLNPAGLFDARWKDGRGDARLLERKLSAYAYSSLPDFMGQRRPQRKLISESVFSLYEHVPTLTSMLEEARAYYAEIVRKNIKARP